MTAGAPDPSFLRTGNALWLAYFTQREDHCAVLRFDGVTAFSFGDPNDEALQHIRSTRRVYSSTLFTKCVTLRSREPASGIGSPHATMTHWMSQLVPSRSWPEQLKPAVQRMRWPWHGLDDEPPNKRLKLPAPRF